MNRIGDWLITLLYVAMIYVLVRPNSQGPAFVGAVGSSVASMINAATGGTTGNGTTGTTGTSQGGATQ